LGLRRAPLILGARSDVAADGVIDMDDAGRCEVELLGYIDGG